MTLSKNYHIWEGVGFAVLALVFYYALELGELADFRPALLPRWQHYVPLLKRFSLALFAIVAILVIGRVVERIIDRSGNNEGVRYNLLRVTRLVAYLFVIIVAVAFLFQNLYAAAVSFGLISLVLGFALQAPITSFIGWLYIVFRRPYQVGDRIEMGPLRGDVTEIGYLDTTIRECSGPYLGNDRLSGRLIHVPNSTILKEQVTNYSGQFGPFIWNETPIQIAYTSDLGFVETCLQDAADEDFRRRYPDRNAGDNAAAVYFRVNAYAWLEAVVTYPVEPVDTTGRRNRILRAALPALNVAPDKVQFPQGSKR